MYKKSHQYNFGKKLNSYSSQKNLLSTVKYPLQNIFQDVEIHPAPEYQPERIQNFTISRVFEEKGYEKFEI